MRFTGSLFNITRASFDRRWFDQYAGSLMGGFGMRPVCTPPGTPPPLPLIGIIELQAKTLKIFEFKGPIVKIFRNKDLRLSKSAEMGLGQFRGPSWWTGSELPQSDLYRRAPRVLSQWISNHYDFKLRSEQSLERAEISCDRRRSNPTLQRTKG